MSSVETDERGPAFRKSAKNWREEKLSGSHTFPSVNLINKLTTPLKCCPILSPLHNVTKKRVNPRRVAISWTSTELEIIID